VCVCGVCALCLVCVDCVFRMCVRVAGLGVCARGVFVIMVKCANTGL
jgi:hypothetical protein